MSALYEFRPPIRLAVIFHTLAIIGLAALAAFGFLQATQAAVGPVFLLNLILGIAAVSLMPILIYRFYSLRHASYVLERDGLHLLWGLRGEDIPMDKVLWVRTAEDLGFKLPPPLIAWPGFVLGERRLPDANIVEYLASQLKGLVLVGTPGRIFAISPQNPQEFMGTFQRLTELGSLSPIQSNSTYSSFLLAHFWNDKLARYLILAALILSLVLLVWAGLSVPGREQVSLHLASTGAALAYVPSVQLLLLPVLNALCLGADLLGGLFFYRRPESRIFGYVLWGSSVVTSVFFLVGLFFILRAG